MWPDRTLHILLVIVCLDLYILFYFIFLLSIFFDLISHFLLFFGWWKRTVDYVIGLFLLPPSCIVVPIGNIVNKLFFPSTFSSSTMSNSQAFILLTMFPPNYMEMDIPAGPVPVNGSKVRERTSSTEKNYSRDTLMSSTWLSVIYHERMTNNSMDVDPEPANNSPAPSHRTE